MFCSRCGKQLPDQAPYCDGCGAVFAPVQQPVYQQPVYQPVPQQPLQPVNPVRPPMHYSLVPNVLDVDAPSLSALKNIFKSPIFILATLLLLTQLVLAGVFAAQSFNDVISLVRVLDLGISSAEMETYYYIATIGSSVLPALLVVALFIAMGCGFVKKGMSVAGVVTLRALVFASLSGVIAIAGGLLVAQIVALVATNATAAIPWELSIANVTVIVANVQVLIWVLMGITVAVAALMIYLHIRMIGLLQAAAQIAKTNKTTKKASVFLAVCMVIAAIVSVTAGAVPLVLDLLPNKLLPMPALGGAALLAWSVIASGVAMLLFAMLIFEYRTRVQPLAYEPKVMLPMAAQPAAPEIPAQAPAAAETPVEKPTEEPAEEPAKEPVQEPAEEPVEEPSEEPVEEPSEEPAEEPTQTE